MASATSAVKFETVNAELFVLTYGAIVTQLVRDFEDPKEVNMQLESMGYNIGVRIVDEFCAKNRGAKCRSFKDSMETLAKDAFRMFLGVPAVLDAWSTVDGVTSVTLRLPDNPLADFVELPPALSELRYSSILCGVIRGALEMLSLRVEVRFVKDVLNGDDTTEMRVTLKEVLADAAGKDYREE